MTHRSVRMEALQISDPVLSFKAAMKGNSPFCAGTPFIIFVSCLIAESVVEKKCYVEMGRTSVNSHFMHFFTYPLRGLKIFRNYIFWHGKYCLFPNWGSNEGL